MTGPVLATAALRGRATFERARGRHAVSPSPRLRWGKLEWGAGKPELYSTSLSQAELPPTLALPTASRGRESA